MITKFYRSLVFVAILFSAYNVNAQIQLTSASSDAGNFTSFTAPKTYDNMAELKAITPPAYYNNPDFGIRVNDKPGWYEQIDKRTLKNRTYKGVGNQIMVESAYSNINYVDANGWYRAVNTKLKPSSNGWAAEQQEISTYMYPDASTALSLGGINLIVFNKNVQFNGKSISTTNYTVGDNGMYIKKAVTNTDKIIRFGRSRIETDYKISQPLKLNSDLVIAEDIILPKGYTISENENYNTEEGPGGLVVKGSDGNIVATLKAPYCYDNKSNSIVGLYQLQKQNGGYRLQVVVPSAWLNAPSRQYPVTIDPVVTGDTAVWSGQRIIGSCLNSIGDDTATLYAQIPADITVTGVYIQSTFYSNSLPTSDGQMFFWTPCGDTISSDISGTTPGWDHIAPAYNFLLINKTYAYCFAPSCNLQYLPITMAIERYAGGTGCNINYIYYDPTNDDNLPFEAYIVGNTVQATWAVPGNICGGICSLTLNATADYGVPPYTISHPWATSVDTFGSYDSLSATSSGSTSITLDIPNCDTLSGTNILVVHPPTITDACGNSVADLSASTISVTSPPNKPTITLNGNVLTSSATQGNQWVRNDSILQGATAETYTATIPGVYQVIAQNPANGCSRTSNPFYFLTGINQASINSNQVSIYPNPASNLTTVEFTSDETNVHLALVNVLGQTLYSQLLSPISGNSYRTNLNLLRLPVGVYEVVITTPSQSVAKEIIKQE